MEAVLKCVNVSKNFRQGDTTQRVINKNNTVFEKATINVIQGASGCGKTTMLNILTGIEKPTEGTVLYQDKDFYNMHEKNQAKIRGEKYGIVFQFFNLLPELTVEENIKLPGIINNKKIDENYYKKLLRILGLDSVTYMYPEKLSGGEQQRVAIARAMILKPKILFADEPTGNLDQNTSQVIVKLLEDINSIFNTTLIVVTHDPMLFKNPDVLFVMEKGKLIKK